MRDSDIFDEFKRFFSERGTRIEFPRRKIIIHEGDTSDNVYLVKNGMVKIYGIDNDGEERLISLIGKGNIFPVSWMLKESPSHGAFFFYEAYTNMSCYRLPKETAKEFTVAHPQVCNHLLDATTKAYITSANRVQNLQKSKIDERTEFILYFIAMRLGTTLDGRIFKIDRAVTQQDIASMAGVSRETEARFLNAIQAEKLAWKEGGRFYVDVSKLRYKSQVY